MKARREEAGTTQENTQGCKGEGKIKGAREKPRKKKKILTAREEKAKCRMRSHIMTSPIFYVSSRSHEPKQPNRDVSSRSSNAANETACDYSRCDL